MLELIRVDSKMCTKKIWKNGVNIISIISGQKNILLNLGKRFYLDN